LSSQISFFEFEKRSKEELEREGLKGPEFDKIIERISRLEKENVRTLLQAFYQQLKARNYVGVTSIENKVIQVIPKFSEERDDKKIVQNLLFMLSYTQRLKIRENDITPLCRRKNCNLYEILIYIYANNLKKLLMKNIYKRYNVREENLSFVKGKILFKENLRYNLVNRSKIYCMYHEFTENNLINQIFKYSANILLSLTHNPENFKILKNIESLLNSVTLRKIELVEFDNIVLNRLNMNLKPLVDMSELIISNSTVELYRGSVKTYSLMFEMEKLFEDFIAEYLSRYRRSIFEVIPEIIIQTSKKYLVDEPKKLFALKPDIILRFEGSNDWIIDTKYKILDPEDRYNGVSQSARVW